jgi:hypothetical protein
MHYQFSAHLRGGVGDRATVINFLKLMIHSLHQFPNNKQAPRVHETYVSVVHRLIARSRGGLTSFGGVGLV